MNQDVPPPDIKLAERLFDQLDEATRKGKGIVRDSYGPGEQAAHDIVRRVGDYLDLEIHTDAAQNLYLTYPGKDREAPAILTGSHLDSVDQGGNYDGAAGVLAGLSVLAGFRRADLKFSCDITVMAIRCEEAAWFDSTYVGSYAAFGEMPLEELDVEHHFTGKKLADQMKEAGCNLEAIRAGEAYLKPEKLRAFIEVHIEQAPYLLENDLPIGIVTGVRGILRHRDARCYGEYGHSGALSRTQRRDAVAASVALLHQLNEEWLRREASGQDLVVTSGEFNTDPEFHGPSKVSGETHFVIDYRSTSEEVLLSMAQFGQDAAREIASSHKVIFNLGRSSYSEPAVMDPLVRKALLDAAHAQGIPAIEMASGAGHDSVVFANFGIPSGMIFIRNEFGSHNPDEAMSMEDFDAACRILAGYIVKELS
ncbi:MAG: hydantoinase/carbamoylase family amidase [Kiloniellales bacterium]|nr:hydantoinase/carbamoylase family amidase [Kiloniellales bacterium]